MTYKRPEGRKPAKEHPISEFNIYGFVNLNNDQQWIAPHLAELHDDGRFALHQFQEAVKASTDLKMADYKPEIVTEKKKELILNGKRALMTFLKKHIEKYKSEVNAVVNEILRVTEPAQHSDPTKAMLQELRYREIRDNLRSIEPKQRRQAVAGNLQRLQACIASPDPDDIIIAPEALTELRREYAFTQDPSLIAKEKDQREIYKAVRARAADISATASKMLIYAKIDDPTPPADHFAVFEPMTEHEKVLADNRIHLWEQQQAKLAKDEADRTKDEGVDLGRDERVTRINRGIQH